MLPTKQHTCLPRCQGKLNLSIFRPKDGKAGDNGHVTANEKRQPNERPVCEHINGEAL